MLAAVLVPATAAYAGSALSGTAYDGTSLHGRYTVDLTPSCSDPDETYCPPPTVLSIDLYTHPQPGSGCKASGYEFDPATISPDGSFSTTSAFSSGSPQLTFTVRGTFLSVGSVHGTITGNHGCGTDPFTINLRPAPLISTPPCVMLAEVPIKRIMGAVSAAVAGAPAFDAAGGTCTVAFGPFPHQLGVDGAGGELDFIVAASAGGAGSNTDGAWQGQRPVAGLGAGATLYYDYLGYNYNTDKHGTSILLFEVEFHRSGVWASLTDSPGQGQCTGPSPDKVPCFFPAAFAAHESHVLEVAKALRSLL
jgi:hypothetical protein